MTSFLAASTQDNQPQFSTNISVESICSRALDVPYSSWCVEFGRSELMYPTSSLTKWLCFVALVSDFDVVEKGTGQFIGLIDAKVFAGK